MALFVEKIGEGEPVVLLHGWGFHRGIWRRMATTMSQHYQSILVDLPGFGQSSFLDSYQLIRVCEAVLEVSPPQATYVGWSLGGVIATAIACFYPQRIKRLVSVASSPCFLQTENWPGLSLEILQNFSCRLIKDYTQTLAEFLYLQLQGSEQWKIQLTELNHVLNQARAPSIETLQASLALLCDTDLRQYLSNIQCPPLYIFGRLDALVPIKIADILPSIMPTAKINILPKAAHVPFISHEKEFIEILSNSI